MEVNKWPVANRSLILLYFIKCTYSRSMVCACACVFRRFYRNSSKWKKVLHTKIFGLNTIKYKNNIYIYTITIEWQDWLKSKKRVQGNGKSAGWKKCIHHKWQDQATTHHQANEWQTNTRRQPYNLMVKWKTLHSVYKWYTYIYNNTTRIAKMRF